MESLPLGSFGFWWLDSRFSTLPGNSISSFFGFYQTRQKTERSSDFGEAIPGPRGFLVEERSMRKSLVQSSVRYCTYSWMIEPATVAEKRRPNELMHCRCSYSCIAFVYSASRALGSAIFLSPPPPCSGVLLQLVGGPPCPPVHPQDYHCQSSIVCHDGASSLPS